MHHPPPLPRHIVNVAPFAVVNIVLSRRQAMLQPAMKQVDLSIILPGQFMSKHPRDNQRSNRTNRVGKKRVRPVERMNKPRIATIGMGLPIGNNRRPPRRLHSATGLERHLVKSHFPRVMRNALFPHQTAKIAIGADIVETVIVNADMAYMPGHMADGIVPPDFKKIAITGGVESEQCAPVLKALRPFSPSARRIFPGGGEDWGAVGDVP